VGGPDAASPGGGRVSIRPAGKESYTWTGVSPILCRTAFVCTALMGCSSTHQGEDGGLDAVSPTPDTPDAFQWTDVSDDAIRADSALSDSPTRGPIITIRATTADGREPRSGLGWSVVGAGGFLMSGATDASGVSVVSCPLGSAPVQVALLDIRMDQRWETSSVYVRSIARDAEIRVHDRLEWRTPVGARVRVDAVGARSDEVVGLFGDRAFDVSALGSIELQWESDDALANAAAFAYRPRTHLWDDIRFALPPGSGTPRSMEVVARNLRPADVAEPLRANLVEDVPETRIPMRIHVERGAWVADGPVYVHSGVALDPQFVQTIDGFEGSLAVFVEEPFSSPGSWPTPLVVGPYERHWRAHLPDVRDFSIPSASGAPVLLGETVQTMTVVVPPTRWAQLVVDITQTGEGLSPVRWAHWIAATPAGEISLLPDGVSLDALGFDVEGRDPVVTAQLVQPLQPSDLEIFPTYRVESTGQLLVRRSVPFR
jgi:hypothetical protein